MQDLIQRIVAETGLDQARAESAVKIILNFINREGPPDRVRELIAKLPDAERLLDAPPGEGGGGGFMSSFGGGAMQAFNELTAAGLGMGEIQDVTRVVMAYAREHAGEDLVGQVVGAIPGLNQFV